MRSREAAALEMERLGLPPADPSYAQALGASERSWPAWRIAQWLQFDEHKVRELMP